MPNSTDFKENKITAEMLRKGGCPVVYRNAQASIESVDEESRVVELSFSSEYEVERYGWVEILGHSDSECDLSRLNNQAPFLSDHNWDDQRGVVEKAWLKNGRGYAQIKLSRNPLGQQLLVDMQDGIRVNVSVGYRIHEAELVKKDEHLDFYRVTQWEPLEISSVSIPADPTVGLGRADSTTTNPVKIKEAIKMEKEENPKEQERSPATNPAEPPKRKVEPTPTDPTPSDAQRIAETAQQYGAVDLGNEHIRSGSTFDAFQRKLMETLHAKRQQPESESTLIDLDLPQSDLKRYSLISALRAAATGDYKKAGLEREVSNAIAKRTGEDPQGIYLSYEALGFGLRQQQLKNQQVRLQSAGGAGLGAELVADELHSEMFIEALRAQAVVGGLGTRFMSGLVGNVDIPKKVSSASFYWVDEDGSPSTSDVGFGVVQMSPKTVSTAVELTRRLMMQSTPDIEAIVRDDIMLGLALALDEALLKGSGTSSQPRGIINTNGIGAVALSPTVSWAQAVEFETDVAEANAASNMMAYLMRPSMRGELKVTEKATNTGQFIWQNNEVNGYQAAVTTQMPADSILAGDFSQSMVGMWGALDVVADRSTKAASGGLVMRLFQDADVAVRHAQAFSLGTKA